MKRILIISLLAIIPFSQIFSQEEGDDFKTLLGNVKSYGGYGGFYGGYTQINNQDAITIGGQAALILNHSFGIGVAGKGFFNEYHYDTHLGENVNLQGGYGGFLIEPILGGKDAIHFTFPIIIGAGGIMHADKFYSSHWDENYYYEDHINDMDAFFVIEPGAEVELNLFKFFRIAVGASYRYTSALDLYDTPKDALNGFSFGASFKFGWF